MIDFGFSYANNSGGRITVQKKHSNVQSTHYNSGFFITTNDYPDFGGGRDADAIAKRLEVFNTVALQRKDPKISGEYCQITKCIQSLESVRGARFLFITSRNNDTQWERNVKKTSVKRL